MTKREPSILEENALVAETLETRKQATQAFSRELSVFSSIRAFKCGNSIFVLFSGFRGFVLFPFGSSFPFVLLSFSLFVSSMSNQSTINYQPSHPVWVLSTACGTSPTVYSAQLIWCNPTVVYYGERSYEVVLDTSRIRPRKDDLAPAPWADVQWSQIRDYCFYNDPRRLARFKGGHPPEPIPKADESPTALPGEVVATKAQPMGLQTAKKRKPSAVALVAGEAESILPASTLKELFTLYRDGTTSVSTEAMAKRAEVLEPDAPFTEELLQGSFGLEVYQPQSTKNTYRQAASRFLEFWTTAKVKEEALWEAEGAGRVLILFYSARVGRSPSFATSIGWSPVSPATAKAEATAIIALLRLFGAPPPPFSALKVHFQKTGATRTAQHSEKLPLFATSLEKIWALPQTSTDPIAFRNTALCVLTYFFMLRGGEARPLRRNQLTLIKKQPDEVWKLTLDHSKSDPLILDCPPPGGSWTGYTSNKFFSTVMNSYLEVFLGPNYPAELPLFPQVTVVQTPPESTDPFSRRAISAPRSSWLLEPMPTCHGGKTRQGYLTTSDPVNKWLARTLPKISVDTHHTMHSLRVGAATEALSLGTPLSQIKQMGHWKSLAVLTYAVETLTSITDTTKQFGAQELRSFGSVVEVKADDQGLDEDGDGNGVKTKT